MTSLTGISSGRVTRATWHRAGSDSSATTSAAWDRMGPPRAASSRPPADDRKVMVWPVAGASTSTRSAMPLRSICLTFPRTRMSRMPGMAPATRSMIPEDSSRLEIRRSPWSARYSSRASSGVMVRARTVPLRDGRGVVHRLGIRIHPGRPEHRSGVVEGLGTAEGGGHPRAALELHHQDGEPCWAARWASAATMVVLPTPPLPATIRTRLWLQKALMSMT